MYPFKHRKKLHLPKLLKVRRIWIVQPTIPREGHAASPDNPAEKEDKYASI